MNTIRRRDETSETISQRYPFNVFLRAPVDKTDHLALVAQQWTDVIQWLLQAEQQLQHRCERGWHNLQGVRVCGGGGKLPPGGCTRLL